MRDILLDAETFTDRAATHRAFAGALATDDSYGANLDALYDVLTAVGPTRLYLKNADAAIVHLGNYGELLLRVLADAAAENDNLTLLTD